MNFVDLNRILQSKIFLHRDEQLQAVHLILGFKLISTRFQSPKHVISKDSKQALINIDVPKFLNKPPPSNTQDAQLSALLAAMLLYSHKKPIPSNNEWDEPRTNLGSDPEDFLTFAYRHLIVQVSTS